MLRHILRSEPGYRVKAFKSPWTDCKELWAKGSKALSVSVSAQPVLG